MFIPRQPVVDNQFCEYVETATTGGVGGAIAHAGAAVFMGDNLGTQAVAGYPAETLVEIFATGTPSGDAPVFGLLMQKIKTGYHEVHPAGYLLKQDFGSSDAHAQPRYDSSGDIAGTQKVPVGVAHDGGVWDTSHYTSVSDGGSTHADVDAGDYLWVTANHGGRLTNQTTGTGNYAQHANAIYPQWTNDDGTHEVACAALVIKGVSAAKSESNANGQTLYPIRIKLLV